MKRENKKELEEKLSQQDNRHKEEIEKIRNLNENLLTKLKKEHQIKLDEIEIDTVNKMQL